MFDFKGDLQAVSWLVAAILERMDKIPHDNLDLQNAVTKTLTKSLTAIEIILDRMYICE